MTGQKGPQSLRQKHYHGQKKFINTLCGVLWDIKNKFEIPWMMYIYFFPFWSVPILQYSIHIQCASIRKGMFEGL